MIYISIYHTSIWVKHENKNGFFRIYNPPWYMLNTPHLQLAMSNAAATFNALRHALEPREILHTEAGGLRDNGLPAKTVIE